MHAVYWVHDPSHTSPLTEGYVGISANPAARFHTHRLGGGNKQLAARIAKGAVMTILHTFETKEEALRKEAEYRPGENIGWNFAAGGGCPPNQTGKSKKNCHQGLVGDARTPAQIAAALEHSKRMKGRRSFRKGQNLPKTHVEALKGPRPEFAKYAKELVECPYCHAKGARLVMRRWHGENCKHKSLPSAVAVTSGG